MPGNSFGKALVLTTFGESHGVAVGGVLDGFPSDIPVDTAFIQAELDRRKPGTASYASLRSEDDRVEILSGLFDGRSTGAPISFLIANRDQRPADYSHLTNLFRPSHGDYTWQMKFGNRDTRGGGRLSARETASRVVGGAFAKLYLGTRNIVVSSAIVQIGPYEFLPPVRVIEDPAVLTFLDHLKAEGDTTGGIIRCSVTGVPPGLGEPVFDKLQADLAKAMCSINAVKGFDFGSGFNGVSMKGSAHNDVFVKTDGKIRTSTNYSGGIQGGISNGEEIYFRVAFKPVSTVMKEQMTVNEFAEEVKFQGKGRHDVCVVPRAMPIVESMAALVLADHFLRAQSVRD